MLVQLGNYTTKHHSPTPYTRTSSHHLFPAGPNAPTGPNAPPVRYLHDFEKMWSRKGYWCDTVEALILDEVSMLGAEVGLTLSRPGTLSLSERGRSFFLWAGGCLLGRVYLRSIAASCDFVSRAESATPAHSPVA